MWFILNPPGKATIQIQSIDNFERLSSKYGSTLRQQNTHDPRYNSALNHLRFYLPDIFPMLDKIVLLDHDVVVQRDLTGLWSVDMKGKVNGAVETCRKGDYSFRKMDMFINFSDPFVAKKFDANACTWAFGMNLFDLGLWRRRNISGLYHKYLQLVWNSCLPSLNKFSCSLICLWICLGSLKFLGNIVTGVSQGMLVQFPSHTHTDRN